MADHAGALYILGLGLPDLVMDAEGLPRLSYIHSPALSHPALMQADVLIGGKKQLASLTDFMGERLCITSDTDALYRRIALNRAQGLMQVALCSGDPLFYGFGATLLTMFGKENVAVVPQVSSLQGAAALHGLAWGSALPLSLHGRESWKAFDNALLQERTLFLLTDAGSTPDALAAYMADRGCTQYRFHVFGNLHRHEGNIQAQEQESFTFTEALAWAEYPRLSMQRVVLLEFVATVAAAHEKNGKEETSERHTGPGISQSTKELEGLPFERESETQGQKGFGISDDQFVSPDRVFTKSIARSTGLAALNIAPQHIVWDLGAGTGAVAIEASRLAHQGHVYAVEEKKARLETLLCNRRHFGAANLTIAAGTLPGCLAGGSLTLPRPDRIFIGGGLGKNATQAQQILEVAWNALLPQGLLVVHCALLASLERGRAFFAGKHITYTGSMVQGSHSTPLAGDMVFTSDTPIFMLVAHKK